MKLAAIWVATVGLYGLLLLGCVSHHPSDFAPDQLQWLQNHLK